jgi:outer membrane protein assembly factor BamE (lipoprotein component of BamABCDE complex)
MSIGRGLLGATLLALIGLNAGCLVGGSSEVKRDGNYVSDQTLNTIEPGKTGKAWVLATLGEPTAKQEIEPGHELWKYSYKETKDSDGYVLFVFGGSGKSVTGGNVFVEFKGDTVSKSWRG